jgi:hypothetical protein
LLSLRARQVNPKIRIDSLVARLRLPFRRDYRRFKD